METEKLTDSEKIEKGYVQVRTIIEIVGKPVEHIKETLENYIVQIKEDPDLEVVEEFIEEPVEKDDLFTTFTEITMWVKSLNKLIAFGFDYMPSSMEILSPEKMIVSNATMTDYLNDLQARLHHVDMLAKNLFHENKAFNKTVTVMVKNISMMALTRKDLSLEQLSKYTGIKTEKLKVYLDKLIEEKRIKFENHLYSLIKEK